jgi:hypothetical protein
MGASLGLVKKSGRDSTNWRTIATAVLWPKALTQGRLQAQMPQMMNLNW